MTTRDERGPAARTIELLRALADGPLSLNAISKATEIPKPSAHRLLAELLPDRVIVQRGEGEYSLGAGALLLVQQILNGRTWGFGAGSRGEMEALRDLTGETVALHVQLGRDRLCISEVESTQPLRYISGVGRTAPLHVGSAGKVLLAWLPTDVVDVYLRTPIERFDSKSITEPAEFRSLLETIHRRGWAESTGERVVGAAAVSVPVLDDQGQLLFSLSVLGPQDRMSAERRRQLVPALQRVAAQLGGNHAAATIPVRNRAGHRRRSSKA